TAASAPRNDAHWLLCKSLIFWGRESLESSRRNNPDWTLKAAKIINKSAMRFNQVAWAMYFSASVSNLVGHCLLMVIGIVQQFCTVAIGLNPASNIRRANWQIGVFSSQVVLDIADERSKRVLIPGSAVVHDRIEWRTAAVTLGLSLALSLCSLVCHLAVVLSTRLRVSFRAVSADAGLQLTAVVTQILCLASGEIGMKRLAAEPESLNAALAQFARAGSPLGPEEVTEVGRGFAFWLLVATVFVHLTSLLCEIPYAILLGELLLSNPAMGSSTLDRTGSSGRRDPELMVIENSPAYPVSAVKDWQAASAAAAVAATASATSRL
uniref:ABC transmembrane type-1 domain-containing protein n=1 Tax=Macrostomum lignano TaxID=282301 RepID=A0A1I8GIC6_9PLAT